MAGAVLALLVLGAWFGDAGIVLGGLAVLAVAGASFRLGRRRQAVAHSLMVYRGHTQLMRGHR